MAISPSTGGTRQVPADTNGLEWATEQPSTTTISADMPETAAMQRRATRERQT